MHNKYIYFGISLVALIFKPKLLRWLLPYLCACGKKVILSFDKFQFFLYNLQVTIIEEIPYKIKKIKNKKLTVGWKKFFP